MVLAGPATDGGGVTNNFNINTTGVKNTVQSIKEIVRNHSDSEIYAMLKETNMDPNETVQKLLNQDPFHEVKRKRDKKKEPQQTGYRGSVDTGNPIGQNLQRAKPPTSWDRNARRGGYSRTPAPGISREFRIVRDNRVINSNAKPELSQPQASGSQQVQPNVPENSSGDLTKQKHSAAIKPKVYMASQGVGDPRDSGPPVAKDLGRNASHSPLSPEESQKTASASNLELQREVTSNSDAPAALTSPSISSVIGVYSSSSDPVHVPSPDSRTAGTVGAIRREVGVVGVRRPSSDRSTAHSFVSQNTYPVSSVRKDMSSPAESFRHTASMSKSNQPNQTSSSNSNMPSISINRSYSNSQYSSKLHQQTVGHQKAVPPSMEWKPKPSQKTTAISSVVVGTMPALSSSCADNCISSNTVDATGLADKLSQANVAENTNVIIPQHFRVPESERTQFKFGSFGACLDSSRDFTSALQATESVELLNDEPSISVSVPVPVSSGEDATADQGDLADGQARLSRSDSPASSVESDQQPIGNHESLSENIDSYAEIGLVQSHSPPYNSPEPSRLQNPSGLPSYSGYDAQTNYDVPFFRNVMDDNVRGQVVASPPEALSSHVANSSPPSSAAMTHQQTLQQQQAVAQMYPQLQFSHFPNFVPYRHIFSPVYVPPMAIPNYPSNPSYPHPSNGSSYLLMPGGNPHLAAGGMKYTPSQYKPVPSGSSAGYGNFTNPSGFTISAPTSIGAATGLEDVTRIKYKDNNLYVPNAQAESSDIWIQTPREVPTLQSAPYYNLSGQAAHGAFMPSHAGHGSFNATAQSSHVQYPGLYHPPQPGSIPNSHHLVHQQVAPGFGGGVGVGVAAPGPQVGTYQQPQVGHLNWAANF